MGNIMYNFPILGTVPTPVYFGSRRTPARSPLGVYTKRAYLNWLAHEATRKFDLLRLYRKMGVIPSPALLEGAHWALAEIDRIRSVVE